MSQEELKPVMSDEMPLDEATSAYSKFPTLTPESEKYLARKWMRLSAEVAALRAELAEAKLSLAHEEAFAIERALAYIRLFGMLEDTKDQVAKLTEKLEAAEARERAKGSPEMIERLAAIEHERWSGWMRYLFSKCAHLITAVGENQRTIPEEYVKHWTRQMNTPYAELSEQEKESDRVEVRETLATLFPKEAA